MEGSERAGAPRAVTGWRRGVRLGVDWGRARIGVAACDPDGVLAYPVETVAQGPQAPERLAAVAAEYEAIEVVLGWPTSLRGDAGPAAEAMWEVAGRLVRVIGVPIRLVDERLTTVTAARQLSGVGRRRRDWSSVIDQVAAVEILQQALDTERRTGHPAGRTIQTGEES